MFKQCGQQLFLHSFTVVNAINNRVVVIHIRPSNLRVVRAWVVKTRIVGRGERKFDHFQDLATSVVNGPEYEIHWVGGIEVGGCESVHRCCCCWLVGWLLVGWLLFL